MNVEPKTSWRRSDQFPNIHGSMYYRNPTIQPPHEHVRHFHCSNHHQTTININLISFSLFLFLLYNFHRKTERRHEGVSGWRAIVLSKWRQMLVYWVSSGAIVRVSMPINCTMVRGNWLSKRIPRIVLNKYLSTRERYKSTTSLLLSISRHFKWFN